MNGQQSEYFISLCKLVTQNSGVDHLSIDGDITSIMPFILKLLGSNELNRTGLNLLIKLLENKFVWRSVEYWAVKSLNLLLAYKGDKSF